MLFRITQLKISPQKSKLLQGIPMPHHRGLNSPKPKSPDMSKSSPRIKIHFYLIAVFANDMILKTSHYNVSNRTNLPILFTSAAILEYLLTLYEIQYNIFSCQIHKIINRSVIISIHLHLDTQSNTSHVCLTFKFTHIIFIHRVQ